MNDPAIQPKMTARRLCLFIMLISAGVSGLLTGCYQDPKGGDPTPIKQETKDFCAFKAGSWWVYKNLKNNLLDTWKITEAWEASLESDRHGAAENFIKMSVSTSWRDTFEYKLYARSGFNFWSNKSFGQSQPAYFEGSDGSNKVPVCDLSYLHSIRQDSIDGKPFLKEFRLQPQPCTNYFPVQITWKNKIGITQMIYSTMDTLQLQDYKVIQ